MNYDTLERAVRVAMINTVGARLKDYNKYIITSNPQEIDTTAVEITFDRKILPLCFFDSKDVSLNVSIMDGIGLGGIELRLGSKCHDTEAASEKASCLLEDTSNGWHVSEDFDELLGLYLTRDFCFDSDDDFDIVSKLTVCFDDLCDTSMIGKLCTFVHYFEDYEN